MKIASALLLVSSTVWAGVIAPRAPLCPDYAKLYAPFKKSG